MLLSRRQFIASLIALSASTMLPAGAAFASVPDAKKKTLLAGCANNICIVDVGEWQRLFTIPLDFFPHSYVPRPLKPGRMWTFQRHKHESGNGYAISRGKNYTSKAVEFDLANGEVTQTIIAKAWSQFRGHGFFVPGTDTLFISRLDDKTGAGHLTGYDVTTGKQIDDHKVSHEGIHECKMLADGTVLIASPGKTKITMADGKSRRSAGFIVHYDLQNGKRLSATPVDNKEQWVAHFALLGDDRLLAMAGSGESKDIGKLSSIFSGKLGDAYLKPIPIENDKGPGVYNEMFSIAIDPVRNVAAIANLGDDNIFLIDLASSQFIRKLPFETPGGVVFDAQIGRFIVNGRSLGVVNDELTEIHEYSGVLPLVNTRGQSHSLLI